VLIDWATFDFNAALVFQGNNSIVSSYETQSASRHETQYEGMHLEIDILSFSDATVVRVIALLISFEMYLVFYV
jgi:hypothetical protein